MWGAQGLGWSNAAHQPSLGISPGSPKLLSAPAGTGAWAGNILHHGLGPKSRAGHALLLVSGKSWAALQTFTCSPETPGQGLQDRRAGPEQKDKADARPQELGHALPPLAAPRPCSR